MRAHVVSMPNEQALYTRECLKKKKKIEKQHWPCELLAFSLLWLRDASYGTRKGFMSNCLAHAFFKFAMLCWGNQVSHFNLVGFIRTRRIIDYRKKNIIFSSIMNVNQFNFRMCFEWNFGLWEYFVFCIMGRMCSPENLIFQTLSPVSISPENCEKTLISVLSRGQCILWTLAEPKMSLSKFRGAQPISTVRVTLMIIAYKNISVSFQKHSWLFWQCLAIPMKSGYSMCVWRKVSGDKSKGKVV